MNYRSKNNLPNISNDYLYDIMKARGVVDPVAYLNMSGPEIHQTDWRHLSQVDEGVPIFMDAIDTKCSVGIIADCDVDGFCSAAMTYLYIKEANPDANIQMYFHTGKAHGIDDNIMDELQSAPVDILIIPDASSNELEQHKTIASLGTRILVIDHHLTDIIDDPYAVRINNQLSDDTVNKTLCGAGVVYFFLNGIDELKGFDFSHKYIDLAAVALVADMMDLRNMETHYLVSTGLSNINNAGLLSFIHSNSYSLGDKTELAPVDIAFYIAPLINSVIRVGNMEQKQCVFYALIDGARQVPSTKRGAKDEDFEILGDQAARIAKNCKALQGRLVDRAMEILEAKIFKDDLLENKILLVPVTEEDDIPSTITGLVAMKLTAKYHHPTMVLRECDDGVFKGSTRAEADTAIGSFKDYMTNTGLVEYAEGHALANGAGIQETNIDEFIKYTNEDLKNVDFNEKFLSVDYIFNDSDNVNDFIFDIEDGHDIWGQGIEEPTFVVEDMLIRREDIQLMKNNCMKFIHNNVSYIIFKNEDAINDFEANSKMRVTIYGKGSINEWCGRKNAQVIINQYDISPVKYEF